MRLLASRPTLPVSSGPRDRLGCRYCQRSRYRVPMILSLIIPSSIITTPLHCCRRNRWWRWPVCLPTPSPIVEAVKRRSGFINEDNSIHFALMQFLANYSRKILCLGAKEGLLRGLLLSAVVFSSRFRVALESSRSAASVKIRLNACPGGGHTSKGLYCFLFRCSFHLPAIEQFSG